MVEVLKAGLYDSIQDLGRFGYQNYGVPISGAMDQYSAKLANSILGNQENEAVLEFTWIGPTLKFNEDTAICLSGMMCNAKINGLPIENNTYVDVKKNDEVSFGQPVLGFRGFMAVSGGFQTERIMESRSFYNHITAQNRLKKGDCLDIIKSNLKHKASHAIVKTSSSHFESNELEVFRGVEFEWLSTEQKNQLFSQEFTISKDSNRMAYQLNERLPNDLKSIITSAVLPGAVQLTPSGQLMLLMRDCQTTGGYPRLLQLSEMTINRLSQKAPGQKIQFKCMQQ